MWVLKHSCHGRGAAPNTQGNNRYPHWRTAIKPQYARRRVCGAAHACAQPASTYDDLWDAFCSKAQGEWEGVTVSFDASGVAQPLPDRYVPTAYKEWGVELFDWQSQSSCVAKAAPERGLRNILKRLMPTVGCEADAIAYVEEADDVWQPDGGSATKPVTPAGGYLAAPAQLPVGGGRAKVEACLAAPEGRTRLRVTAALMQHWESKQWHVASVDLSRETYDGPFNGGVELSGCAGGGKPFAKEPVTSVQQLAGEWRTATSLRYARSGEEGGLELRGPDGSRVERVATLAGAGSLLLPLGVWVGCAAAGSDVLVEVGSLRGEAERDVAVCRYRDGCLQEVVLASEEKSD